MQQNSIGSLMVTFQWVLFGTLLGQLLRAMYRHVQQVWEIHAAILQRRISTALRFQLFTKIAQGFVFDSGIRYLQFLNSEWHSLLILVKKVFSFAYKQKIRSKFTGVKCSDHYSVKYFLLGLTRLCEMGTSHQLINKWSAWNQQLFNTSCLPLKMCLLVQSTKIPNRTYIQNCLAVHKLNYTECLFLTFYKEI